jgi:hypothetical protein
MEGLIPVVHIITIRHAGSAGIHMLTILRVNDEPTTK